MLSAFLLDPLLLCLPGFSGDSSHGHSGPLSGPALGCYAAVEPQPHPWALQARRPLGFSAGRAGSQSRGAGCPSEGVHAGHRLKSWPGGASVTEAV